MTKRAAITGATGLLGANLADHLLSEGYEVKACKRKSSKIDHLSSLNIEWHDAPLDDESAMSDVFADCDVVFHCAAAVSIVKKRTPILVNANILGTEHVINAVKKSKARLVHTSTVAAVAISENGEPSDESATYNFDKFGLADGYSTTKRDAEEAVLRAVKEQDLNAVVINPGYMFGAYDARPSSGALIRDVIRGRVPGVTSGRNNFADVRDVARGMRLAYEKGKTGERYILAGHNMHYADILSLIAKVGEVKAPKMNLPKSAAMLTGYFYDLKERISGRADVLNSNTIRWAYEKNFVFSSEKAKKELGYNISPLDESIGICIDWFRDNGVL